MTFWTGPGYNYREDLECCYRCKYSYGGPEGECVCGYGMEEELKNLSDWDNELNYLDRRDRNVAQYGLCDKYEKEK